MCCFGNEGEAAVMRKARGEARAGAGEKGPMTPRPAPPKGRPILQRAPPGGHLGRPPVALRPPGARRRHSWRTDGQGALGARPPSGGQLWVHRGTLPRDQGTTPFVLVLNPTIGRVKRRTPIFTASQKPGTSQAGATELPEGGREGTEEGQKKCHAWSGNGLSDNEQALVMLSG